MAAERQRRKWWRSAWLMLAILSIVIGLLAGAAVAFYANNKPARYESTATLIVDQQPAVFQTGDEGLLGKLSRLRFKYVGIIGTMLFAQPVAEDTGLPVGAVHAGLSASADIDTLLLEIHATMASPGQAQRVAQSAADELVTYIHEEQFDAKVASQDQVTFTVVSPASGAVKTEPATKKVLLEGVVVFLAISVLGALGADLLRRQT